MFFVFSIFVLFLTCRLSGQKRENLVRRYLKWRHVFINHCLVRQLEGAAFMIKIRQGIGCVEPLSQLNKLKQKSDTLLSRCSTFCPFLNHPSFQSIDFAINHCSYSRLTIFFLSTHTPHPSHCIEQRHEWSPSCWQKVPTETFDCFQNSISSTLRTLHYSSLRPFERVHKHICGIIYLIMHRTSILW